MDRMLVARELLAVAKELAGVFNPPLGAKDPKWPDMVGAVHRAWMEKSRKSLTVRIQFQYAGGKDSVRAELMRMRRDLNKELRFHAMGWAAQPPTKYDDQTGVLEVVVEEEGVESVGPVYKQVADFIRGHMGVNSRLY